MFIVLITQIGATRPKGSMVRTYELICQHGCYSYNLYKYVYTLL